MELEEMRLDGLSAKAEVLLWIVLGELTVIVGCRVSEVN